MNEYTFDYVERNRLDVFCKTVLRNEAINYLLELSRRRDREKSLDTLPQAEMDKLCTLDEYPSDSFVFSAFGFDLHIRDELVAGAFATLPEQEQQILILRFVAATFSEEIHNIYDAMKLRGIALSWKNVFTRPMLILEAIAIPIVMRSASIAEELSASAVTRGIDNPAQRTSFIQLKVHAKDWMVLCFFLIAFVVLFFCKYQIYGRI